MSEQQVTPGEAHVIAKAAVEGKAVVEMPFLGKGGKTSSVPFCGLCGRMVCHPSCPRLRDIPPAA